MAKNKKEIIALEKVKSKITEMQDDKNYPVSYSMPVGLQFELTAKCNLTCKHCYNRSGDDDKKTLMKIDNWINLSKHLVENGGIFQCILSGGEPLLLGDKLFDIMDILHEDGTAFILISNGLLFTKEIAKKLTKYKFYRIQISIDGSDENFHDEFRGKKGSWKNAVEACHYIASYGIPLSIACSVVPNNIETMDEMADLAYSLGCASLIFGETMLSGRANEFQEYLLNEEQKKIMNKNSVIISKKYQDKMEISIGASEEYQLSLNQLHPTDTAIIRPNGDIRLDCTAPFTMGNVLNENLATIWKNKSKDVWKSKEVSDFIENKNSIINHVNEDIKL